MSDLKKEFRKEVFSLIKQGLKEDIFKKIYEEYFSQYCNFMPACSSECGVNKNEKTVAIMSVVYFGKEYHLCEKHSNLKCWKCGKPAISECSYAGQFVCGVTECSEHSHYESHSKK